MEDTHIQENNDNTFAFNRNREYVKITDALSGAMGYYCVGCGSEMIAHKSQKIKEYFRHHPKDISINRKCIWSDESTRHKLAKDILQRIKYIKVPKVLKSSPDGNGPVYKIRDSEIIYANHVEIEMSFFEDEQGEIKYKHLSVEELSSIQNILIRPDVSFFDVDGKPILLIEIVSTHRIKEDKLLKIKRLGIDTVQVKIPNNSIESINTCFDKTAFTQWIYNYEEQNTTYLSISTSFGKGISSFDELPEGIHEETFKCRKNQIGNLIRAFERCLEQESYHSIEREFELQLLEVERNTKRNKQRLRELQRNHKTRIEGEFAGEGSEFRDRENAFRIEKNRVEGLNQAEQDRITTETGNLETATNSLVQAIREIKIIIGNQRQAIRNQQEEIRRLELSIENTVSF